jgi:hypothetical protein
MKKKISVLIAIVLVIAAILFFTIQRTDIGYVMKVDDQQILVVTELEYKKLEDKNIDERSETFISQGTFYDVPLINKMLKTDFKVGQKVKIYWSGGVLESAPGQVKGTSLIWKINE